MESERVSRRGGRRGDRRGGRNNYRENYYERNTYSNEIQVVKPTFKQVSDICPEMIGINIKLKVVSLRSDSPNEVYMGDETGTVIVIVAKEEILRRLHEGSSIIVRNGYVQMKQDAFIRLVINEWGKISISDEEFSFTPKKGNNISEVEYTIE